ncbi:MAG: hypothetical protein LBN39_04675, partial [Planctomycetaceae bacterium]|nr:hypothetical protein [Planctomycetaceae bacterium]
MLIFILAFTVSVLSRSAAGQDTVLGSEPVLTLQFKNSSAIFTPQTPIQLEVKPSDCSAGLHLNVSVFRTSDFQENSAGKHKTPKNPLSELQIQIPPQTGSTAADSLPVIPVSFLAPQDEGDYTVVVKSTEYEARKTGFTARISYTVTRSPLSEPAVIPFTVLDPKPVQRPVGSIDSLLKNDLLEFNGSNALPLRMRLSPVLPKIGNIAIPKLPDLPKWTQRPLSNVQTGNTVADSAGIADALESAEETLPLPVKEPGKRHLLEIEYPAGLPQRLGIRIEETLETGTQYTVVPGIHAAEEIAAEPANGRTAKHRVLFEPQTKHAAVHFVNEDPLRSAEHGKVRLYQIDTELLPKPFEGQPQRKVLAELAHRTEQVPPVTGLNAAKRFVDALQLGGYDGAMLSTSEELSILHCLFDREGLTLIPAVDFNFPLPQIDAMLRENPALQAELLWDVYGKEENSRSASPYNLLHPAVQEAMFGVVRDILQRYSKHPSFGGIAVQLHPNGYAQLPLFLNSIDERTFQEFRKAVKDTIGFPADVEQWDAAAKARFIQNGQPVRDAWFRWRMQQTTVFYHRLAKHITAYRPDAVLYLAGSAMLDSPELQRYNAPALPRRIQTLPLIRMLGIDPAELNTLPSLIFLRPDWGSDDLEFGTAFIRSGITSGILFHHKEPPLVPAEYRNRRRFVRQLAQSDTAMFFDGGMFLPFGEEQYLYDFLAAFRKLPLVPFKTFVQNSMQPITVRYLNTPEQLLIYLVNDAPFGVAAKLTFSAPQGCVLTELSGRRTAEPLTNNIWTVSLLPYDFLAVAVDAPNAAVQSVTVHNPAGICKPGGVLEQKVEQLRQRVHSAQTGVPWNKLENPDFETPADTDTVPGWSSATPNAARLDTIVKRTGSASLKLSVPTAAEPVFVHSPFFEMPPTGRLYLSMYLGIPGGTTALPLEVIAMESGDNPQFTAVPLEPQIKPYLNQPAGELRWYRVFAAFDSLPAFKEAAVGLRLLNEGTVYIDDVSLYQFMVNSNELKELQRLLLTADERQRTERVSDLLLILDGYWAQFLYRYVPVGDAPAVNAENALKVASNAAVSAPPKPKEPPKKKEEPGLFDRFKNWNPFKS